MADIKQKIQFNKNQIDFISKIKTSDSFSYKKWGDDELLDLRCYIRNYYRDIQKGECAFCKKDLSIVAVGNAHVEHIVPKSIYPNFMFEPKNLCVICADCNQIKRDQEITKNTPNTLKRKYIKYPRTSKSFLMVHPHFDKWNDYLEVFNGFYVGKDDHKDRKGSFTIYACGLNRKLSKFGYIKEVYTDNEIMEAARNLIESNSLMEKCNAIETLKKILRS
ncbi:HNH endonuclease [Enterovibrio norvegicus]|uniref:HNH endonuclease n=1 Tax=Enterovibrio norvegicus TaxID=188144 RepID=UPI0013D7421D|nr:HNH endonuclease domain-containing protein [Enterovibrio norvegicus]